MFNLKTITFDQIKTSSIALEFDEVIPDEIYSWTEADFAKYQVPIRNSRFPITDFFKITVEGLQPCPGGKHGFDPGYDICFGRDMICSNNAAAVRFS